MSERARVSIEAMREEELAAATRIDVASFAASEHAPAGAPPGAEVERRMAQLREELARPWARVRVARAVSGEVVGYALFWHVVDEVHLLNVAVAPEARRRGVGRALMDDLFSYAAERDVAKVLLEVRAENVPAIAMYESYGFERLGVRARYYADGEDALDMMRTLGK